MWVVVAMLRLLLPSVATTACNVTTTASRVAAPWRQRVKVKGTTKWWVKQSAAGGLELAVGCVTACDLSQQLSATS